MRFFFIFSVAKIVGNAVFIGDWRGLEGLGEGKEEDLGE